MALGLPSYITFKMDKWNKLKQKVNDCIIENQEKKDEAISLRLQKLELKHHAKMRAYQDVLNKMILLEHIE